MPNAERIAVKFLLVDDREENLVALSALLRRDGLELLVARSGYEALELLLVHDVALALVDVQMPEMDGFALAELMRGAERSRHVPIIFLTAGLEERQRVFEGYDAGAVDFLIKPVEPRILLHKAAIFFDLYVQRQKLAATLRLNETFVAAVGHDLRNPLNALLMAADLIRSSSKEPQTVKLAERLRSSGHRMSMMIDELFDLSRARLSGGIPISREHVDLAPIIGRAVAELEATSPGRAIETHVDGDLAGRFDGGRVAQVVSNLVGNALRHGEETSPVVVRVRGDKDVVSVCVENRGCIPDDVRPHIFDPFRSGREAGGKREGLGLGLYIVKQLVEAHGGTIDLESTETRGTRFEIRLPRSSRI